MPGLIGATGRALRRSLEIRQIPIGELAGPSADVVRRAADSQLIDATRRAMVWS